MSNLRRPRLKKLGKISGLTIYVVSGQQVRNETDIDFTMGGNEAIYTYVPKNEIWLDDAAGPFDRTATTLHEMVERDLMLHHGMDYDQAHDAASARERDFRRDQKRRGVTKYDLAAVAAAYRRYLHERSAVKPAKKPKVRKTARQLEREIATALGGH